VSWPVIGTGLLCYGLFYGYERLRWTDGVQRSTFNKQLATYLREKLVEQISLTGHSYTRIIERCVSGISVFLFDEYSFVVVT